MRSLNDEHCVPSTTIVDALRTYDHRGYLERARQRSPENWPREANDAREGAPMWPAWSEDVRCRP